MKRTDTGKMAQGPSLIASVQKEMEAESRDEPQQANSAGGLAATSDFPGPRNLSATRIRKLGSPL